MAALGDCGGWSSDAPPSGAWDCLCLRTNLCANSAATTTGPCPPRNRQYVRSGAALGFSGKLGAGSRMWMVGSPLPPASSASDPSVACFSSAVVLGAGLGGRVLGRNVLPRLAGRPWELRLPHHAPPPDSPNPVACHDDMDTKPCKPRCRDTRDLRDRNWYVPWVVGNQFTR